MKTLKYKVIKSRGQYDQYCKTLEELLGADQHNEHLEDEIELLTLLIEKWDADHSTHSDMDPISLLKYLIEENNLKAKDIADILAISKSHVSELLNYKKRLSKDIVRKLSAHFCLSEETFNKSYNLVTTIGAGTKHTKAA